MKPVTQHDRNLEHLTDDLGDHSLHQLQRSDFYNLLNCLFIITQVAEIHRPACCPASSSIQLRCVHIVIKGLVSWQHSYIIVCSFWDQSLIHAEGSSKFSDIRRMVLIKTFCSTAVFLCRWRTISVAENVTPDKMSITWVDNFHPVHFRPMVTNFQGCVEGIVNSCSCHPLLSTSPEQKTGSPRTTPDQRRDGSRQLHWNSGKSSQSRTPH